MKEVEKYESNIVVEDTRTKDRYFFSTAAEAARIVSQLIDPVSEDEINEVIQVNDLDKEVSAVRADIGRMRIYSLQQFLKKHRRKMAFWKGGEVVIHYGDYGVSFIVKSRERLKELLPEYTTDSELEYRLQGQENGECIEVVTVESREHVINHFHYDLAEEMYSSRYEYYDKNGVVIIYPRCSDLLLVDPCLPCRFVSATEEKGKIVELEYPNILQMLDSEYLGMRTLMKTAGTRGECVVINGE